MTRHQTITDENKQDPGPHLLPQGMGQLGSAIGAVGAPFNECIATIRTAFQLYGRHYWTTRTPEFEK